MPSRSSGSSARRTVTPLRSACRMWVRVLLGKAAKTRSGSPSMAIPCLNALLVRTAPANGARTSTRRTPVASLICWRAELSRASSSGAETRGGQ